MLRKTLFLLSVIGSSSKSSEGTFIAFFHGLRGNKDRWEMPYLKCCFPEAYRNSILLVNGPDYIEESVSQSINPQKIKGSVWGRIRREGILLEALQRTSMGQEGDMERVEQELRNRSLLSENGILIGQSKGASLGANLLQRKKWKGAILITPFYHASLAFRDFPPFCILPHVTIFDSVLIPFLRYFLAPRYQSLGIQPSHLAHSNLNKSTPILIISVKNDKKIPQYHQIALYSSLKEKGYDVYWHELQEGNHDFLAEDHPEAKAKLATVIHNFIAYIETKIHPDNPLYTSPTSLHDINRNNALHTHQSHSLSGSEPDLLQQLTHRIKCLDWSAPVTHHVPSPMRLAVASLGAFLALKCLKSQRILRFFKK